VWDGKRRDLVNWIALLLTFVPDRGGFDMVALMLRRLKKSESPEWAGY